MLSQTGVHGSIDLGCGVVGTKDFTKRDGRAACGSYTAENGRDGICREGSLPRSSRGGRGGSGTCCGDTTEDGRDGIRRKSRRGSGSIGGGGGGGRSGSRRSGGLGPRCRRCGRRHDCLAEDGHQLVVRHTKRASGRSSRRGGCRPAGKNGVHFVHQLLLLGDFLPVLAPLLARFLRVEEELARCLRELKQHRVAVLALFEPTDGCVALKHNQVVNN
mmetsp:Transcript_53649/g.106757  ORF Transcript_53649/g.106757 Transcript_53649/m.106757 type:complete len:217 (-) Transcript_53649:194-844(-)